MEPGFILVCVLLVCATIATLYGHIPQANAMYVAAGVIFIIWLFGA